MKPEWKDAPEWANYLAQDNDGMWYWYEFKPYTDNGDKWHYNKGKCQIASISTWKDTLEKRSEKKNVL